MKIEQLKAIPGDVKVLKETKSKCNTCGNIVPAKAIEVKKGATSHVIMRKNCERHGVTENIISSDARFYYLAQGHPSNRGGCGCGGGTCKPAAGDGLAYLGSNFPEPGKEGLIEKMKTCLALIEIVDSCNLQCPTCFSDSPLGTGTNKKQYTFENITGRIQDLINRKGPIEILQLSGGEPTLHDYFFKLVAWIRENPDIQYLLVNTNGMRCAMDHKFMAKLGAMFKNYDNIQLYLQFDGPQEAGQTEIRGIDLRKVREIAIRNCAAYDLPITLAMTVNETTRKHLWETIEFALPYENIRGVSFQPMFLSGRNSLQIEDRAEPITTADILLGVHDQSHGLVRLEDFTALPCGDPNCANIGWLFRMKGRFYSPTMCGVDVAKLQSTLPDRLNYTIEDLRKCGCDGTALGDLMKKLELKESNAFRLVTKPFMDWGTWDEDRIDRCCTHVITPDGKLDSFCRYYSKKPMEVL